MRNDTVMIEVNGKTMNITHDTTVADIEAFTGTTGLFEITASDVFIAPILNISAIEVIMMFNDYNKAYGEGNGRAFIVYSMNRGRTVTYWHFKSAFVGEFPSPVALAKSVTRKMGLPYELREFFDFEAFADSLIPEHFIYSEGYVFTVPTGIYVS